MPHPLEAGTIRILKPTAHRRDRFPRLEPAGSYLRARGRWSGKTIQVQFTGSTRYSPRKSSPNTIEALDNGDIAFCVWRIFLKTPLHFGLARRNKANRAIHFRRLGIRAWAPVEGIHARGEILGIVTENGQHLLQLRSAELNQGHSGGAGLGREARRGCGDGCQCVQVRCER